MLSRLLINGLYGSRDERAGQEATCMYASPPCASLGASSMGGSRLRAAPCTVSCCLVFSVEESACVVPYPEVPGGGGGGPHICLDCVQFDKTVASLVGTLREQTAESWHHSLVLLTCCVPDLLPRRPLNIADRQSGQGGAGDGLQDSSGPGHGPFLAEPTLQLRHPMKRRPGPEACLQQATVASQLRIEDSPLGDEVRVVIQC
jgi:hypothetical protein